jgi:hypothetical protein
MEDTRVTTDEALFWKRLGLRALRLFGVACVFVGYLIVVASLLESGRPLIGWGLIGLGLPHLLAANRLQAYEEFADPDFIPKQSFGRMLATSLILPGAMLALMTAFAEGPRPDPVFRWLMATIIVYLIGAWIIFLRRSSDWNPTRELTPWDRTYIRWGWVALLAIGFPIMLFLHHH